MNPDPVPDRILTIYQNSKKYKKQSILLNIFSILQKCPRPDFVIQDFDPKEIFTVPPTMMEKSKGR